MPILPPTNPGVNTPPETAHVLDTTARPAACSCGKAKWAGSPTFVRERHAAHVEGAARRGDA